MKQYTDITVLLDRSGSMATIRRDMEGAFNEFIKEHQKVPSTRMTLIQFDDQDVHDVVYENSPIRSVGKLELKPRGWTPLVDAFVTAIDCTGQRLSRMKESDRPDQVLFVVITDGEENYSKRYKRSDVANRVKHQTDNYKWQFVYLGANQDAIKEAGTYGIAHTHALDWNPSTKGIAGAFASLTANTMTYTTNTNRSVASSLNFDEEQRKRSKQ